MENTKEELLHRYFIEDMLQWPRDKFYNTFGAYLETIVNYKKDELQLKLKHIWKNRELFCFKETGERIGEDGILVYFNPKKVKHYSLHELEKILETFDNETYKIYYTDNGILTQDEINRLDTILNNVMNKVNRKK